MTKFEDLIDPELHAPLQMVPPEFVSMIGDNPPQARAMSVAMLEQMAGMIPPSDVTVEKRLIPGPDGDVPVYIYQPPEVSAPRPGLLWIHGGGYIIGTGEDDVCKPLAEYAGCTIVSADYRLATEHPFPAGPEDCHAALLWMVENAEELGIDTERSFNSETATFEASYPLNLNLILKDYT